MKNFWEDPELIEAMAKELHDLWMEEKLSQGWTYGPVRDNEKKTHPNLVPYEELPEDVKELDRMFVREIPEVFRLAGLSLEKVEDSPEFVERLAVGVHELWRRKRASQGWTEETDPQMVDYERLPESSKELNRKTARTIVGLVKKHMLSEKRTAKRTRT